VPVRIADILQAADHAATSALKIFRRFEPHHDPMICRMPNLDSASISSAWNLGQHPRRLNQSIRPCSRRPRMAAEPNPPMHAEKARFSSKPLKQPPVIRASVAAIP
jgi:hypothetical protein